MIMLQLKNDVMIQMFRVVLESEEMGIFLRKGKKSEVGRGIFIFPQKFSGIQRRDKALRDMDIHGLAIRNGREKVTTGILRCFRGVEKAT